MPRRKYSWHYWLIGLTIGGIILFNIPPTKIWYKIISDKLSNSIGLLKFQNDSNSQRNINELLKDIARRDKIISDLVAGQQLKKWEQIINKPIMPAQIISRIPLEFSALYRLNLGAEDGIKEGMAVVAQEGILIGTVLNIHPHNSEMLPIVNEQSHIGARLSNSQSAIGIVNGDADVGIRLDMVPLDVKLSPGDLVVTSNIDALIPDGLVIGSIDQIINEPRQIFQQAVLRAALLPSQTVTVGIILSHD